MKLDYHILWVEDDPSWQQSVVDVVREELEQDGFELLVTTASGRETLPTVPSLREFDLILMDLNLDSGSGAELIQRIRQHDVYTDVVFYSQSGTAAVRDEVRRLNLDGVFCVDRREEFRDRVPRIIRMTVRKLQSLNGLRGVVVAVAGELDSCLLEVVEKHDNLLLESDRLAFRKSAWSMLKESLESDLKKVETAIQSGASMELPGGRLLDASKRLRLAIRAAEKRGESLPVGALDRLRALKDEVLELRNLLAHELATREGDLLVVRSRRNAEKVLEFDDDSCRITRSTLRLHKKNLEELLSVISSELRAPA